METSPDLSVANLGELNKEKRPILVYSDVVFIRKTLTDPRYELTKNRDDADILWLFDHFKDYESLSRDKPRSLVNQFPSETVMTIKDLLSALGSESDWIVKTFNLKTELSEFIRHYHESQQQFDDREELETSTDCPCNCHNLDIDCGVCERDKSCAALKSDVGQVWIVKPWNLARGMGIFITQNIDHILRIVEAYPSEPKVRNRY